MKLVGKILMGAGGLIVVILVIAYAADMPLDATITEKDCFASLPSVSVLTDFMGIAHTLEVAYDQCNVIQKGNFVRYHVRTGHTIIYSEKGGDCLFDSQTFAC